MTIELSTESAIARLAASALDATLPRGEWTHAAHFALALHVLRHRPELATPEAFRAIILRLNAAHGTANTDSSGYHHTITIASLDAAARVLADHAPDEPLHCVLAALVAGPLGRPDWIFAHWSHETLFSVAARRDWVPPDLTPMPG